MFFQVFGSKGEIWGVAEKVNSKRKYLRHFDFNLKCKLVVWETGQIFELHRALHLHSLIFCLKKKYINLTFAAFLWAEKFSWVKYCCTKLQHTHGNAVDILFIPAIFSLCSLYFGVV